MALSEKKKQLQKKVHQTAEIRLKISGMVKLFSDVCLHQYPISIICKATEEI